jgi:MFS family permease
VDNAVAAVMRRPVARRLLLSITVSAAGRWIYNVGLAAYVYDATHSAGWLAALAVGRYLPSLLVSPLAAIVAGRFPLRRTMIACDVVAAAAVAAITVCASAHASVLLVVFLAAAASSVTRARVPVTAAFLADLVGESELAAANAAMRSTESAALVLGPLIGAGLVALAHPAAALAATAIAFALSALATTTLPAGDTPGDPTLQTGALRELAAGVQAIARRPASRYFALLGAASSLLFGVDTVLTLVLVRRQLHAGSASYGLLLAGLGLGGLLGALAVDRMCRTRRLGVIAAAALTCYAAPTVVFVVVHSQVMAVGVEVLRGAGSLVAEAVALTALQRSARSTSMPRVLAVFHGGLLAALVAGAALTPLLLHAAGLHGALVVAGVAIPALVLLAVPRLVALDRAGEAWAAELARRVAVLDELAIFAGARRPTLERLAAGLTEVVVDPDIAVITEGQPADAFYVVAHGSVDVLSDSEGGRLLRHLEAPTYVGEIGLIHRVPRTATVRTTSTCLLFRASGEDFLAALSDAPIAPALVDGVVARLTQNRAAPAPGAAGEPDRAAVPDPPLGSH